MKTLPAGWSQLTASLLEAIFIDAKVASGIDLKLRSGAVKVEITFGLVIGDEEAINAMWFTKGASGLVPCALKCSCTNKPCHTDVAANIASLSERDPTIPNLATGNVAQLGKRSDSDIWQMYDSLGPLSATDRSWWHHVYGLKWHPKSLLAHIGLRQHIRPSSTRYDPMHIMASNGLLGSNIAMCLDAMKEATGNYWAEYRAWEEATGWSPKTTILSAEAEQHTTGHLKSGASEIFFQYPMFREYVLALWGETAPEAYIQSFLHLAKLCDAIRWVKQGAALSVAAHMRNHSEAYLKATVEAYGYMSLRFKDHQQVHLHEQLELDQFWVDCWVCERKHKPTISIMTNNKSRHGMEKGALARTLNHQVHMLKSPGWTSHLVGRTELFPELARQLGALCVKIGRGVSWQGKPFTNGDFVFLDTGRSEMVSIMAGVSIDEEWGLLIKQTTLLTMTTTSSKWIIRPEVVFRRLSEGVIALHVAFHKVVGQQLEVLH